jgi:hypothetical protein
MRQCAWTDLCGGRSAMVVPTATVVPGLSKPEEFLIVLVTVPKPRITVET